MPFSWNEIKSPPLAFSKEWADVSHEEFKEKPFVIEFLYVLNIQRKRVTTFECKVKKLDDADSYIDHLWKDVLLVEMKYKGKDLEKAYKQAKGYCQHLKEHEFLKSILVSDFYTFQLYHENKALKRASQKALMKK